ncbi:MAG: hypothetical protein WDW36_008157 [Sanguina aurantia]
MESVRGLTECIELLFGESIVARDEATVILSAGRGLGPPDLCWLQKATVSALTGAKAGEPGGYYHHALGRDVSSSAAVAAYFASITMRVEAVPWMRGFWNSNQVKVQRGFYCTYDPFTRADVRCELCIPGGVVCGALDAGGQVHEVTPALWRNVQVAAFLRAELYDPELVSFGSVVMRYEPLPSPEEERRLLGHILEMYSSKVLPQGLELLTEDKFGGCIAEHMDILLFAVSRHFGRRQRWEAAVDFFSRLSGVYTPAAVYVAAVQRELGQFEDTLRTLSAAVEAEPHCTQLLVALAGECLSAQQVETASKLARRALRIDAGLRPAWLVLARCYVRQDEPGLALVTLNIVPTPPTPLGKEAVRRGPDPGGASGRAGLCARTSRASSRRVRATQCGPPSLLARVHAVPNNPACEWHRWCHVTRLWRFLLPRSRAERVGGLGLVDAQEMLFTRAPPHARNYTKPSQAPYDPDLAQAQATIADEPYAPQPYAPQPYAPQPRSPMPHSPYAPQPRSPMPHSPYAPQPLCPATPMPHIPMPHSPMPHNPMPHIPMPHIPHAPQPHAPQPYAPQPASTQGHRALAILPARMMVNRDPNDLGLWADVGPHRITHAVLAAVYGVLQGA